MWLIVKLFAVNMTIKCIACTIAIVRKIITAAKMQNSHETREFNRLRVHEVHIERIQNSRPVAKAWDLNCFQKKKKKNNNTIYKIIKVIRLYGISIPL